MCEYTYEIEIQKCGQNFMCTQALYFLMLDYIRMSLSVVPLPSHYFGQASTSCRAPSYKNGTKISFAFVFAEDGTLLKNCFMKSFCFHKEFLIICSVAIPK